MPKSATSIFLLTYTDAEGEEHERLVRAAKPTEAMRHAVGVRRASADDAARICGKGGKIEEAGE